MIDYQRGSWYRTCFSFYGTVLPQVLGRVGVLTGFCLLLVFLDAYVFEGSQHEQVHEMFSLNQLGHNVLGVAMSMLIVFRTNSSNNRYWEARSHWGMIVNSSRSLARMAAVYAGPAEDLARLLAAYVQAVKENLRGNRDLAALRHLIPGRLLERAAAAKNPPSILARSLSEWIENRQSEKRLDPLMAMRMEQLIAALVDAQGACERIQKTPLPFVYAALIKQLLLLYLGSLPFVLVHPMGFAAPLAVAVVSLGLLGIEEAGVEIEDPFGLDPNHLPLDAICETIARDVVSLTDSKQC